MIDQSDGWLYLRLKWWGPLLTELSSPLLELLSLLLLLLDSAFTFLLPPLGTGQETGQ